MTKVGKPLGRRTFLGGVSMALMTPLLFGTNRPPTVSARGTPGQGPGHAFFYAGSGLFLPVEYRDRLVALGLTLR
jgi:hypothetical protein